MKRLSSYKTKEKSSLVSRNRKKEKREIKSDGQIGREKTVEEYLDRLVQVFRQVKRVLKKDGTCFIVIGDSYAGSGGGKGQYTDPKYPKGRNGQDLSVTQKVEGYKSKDLMGIPWRLSYITARYGIVKNISEVESELKSLFQNMYTLTYKEEIEIRYRTVTSSYMDADGNEHTESHEEPYEYKKLIVTLEKREMDSIIRETFKSYTNNLAHYETLFLAQGNMGQVFGNTDLINSNGGIGGGKEYEASSEVQKKIVNAAYVTPSPGMGWCAMWVSQVYQNAGLGYIGGNANDMYRNYTFTSDKSKLKVGMLVAVESNSSGGSLGATYGHVGIYIGDGKVMDNIGRIRVTTIDNWIATFCKHHPVGFGFPPSVQK